MQSMTGYGKGVASFDGKSITVEIKTVNHRYLDWGIKLPRTFMFLEDKVKKLINSKISRGHVDLFLTFEQSSLSSQVYVADIQLAKNYLDKANELSSSLNLDCDLTISKLMKVPDVLVKKSVDENEDVLEQLVCDALSMALDNLKIMRANDGKSLFVDITEKLDIVEKSLDKVKIIAPGVVDDYKSRLENRIAEISNSNQVDESRIATEVAIFADRCSVDEEITRLSAHIENMKQLIKSIVPVGRKLDFLVQEMNRETNTIGSKANHLDITNEVLCIKNEIEKIREQAQNIE